MGVLLLRLAGPMQSWGVQSRVAMRETGLEPSKSGVVGLLCAALGRARWESVDDLAALQMGVRVDMEGVMARDYHMALNVLDTFGDIKPSEPSSRYYLTDARFLVGLEGEDISLLTKLYDALRAPYWPLYLGRKAFVPGEPVWLKDGLKSRGKLEPALIGYPWIGCSEERWQTLRSSAERPIRLVIEDPSGPEVRPDQPISFAERIFAPRRVSTKFIAMPEWKEGVCISRD